LAKNEQAGGVSEFLLQLEKTVAQHHLLAPGQKLLAAVSGGVDSMVLLHALDALAARHRWQIFVAHFNHQLRGQASDGDERLVRQTAARLNCPFLSGGADVRAFATQAKISIEMAARKLRHEFLARTACAEGMSVVALAHHADDQMELFFLRLLRGAGGAGLAGMKWLSPSPASSGVMLVRPFLEISKAELLAFARASQIRFRLDASNIDTDVLRNRIRQELLPLLRREYQPGLDQILMRVMNIVGAEAEFVSAAAKTARAQSNLPRTACGAFDDWPLAVQRQALQQQLTELGVAPDFDLIEQLREVPGSRVSVGAGVTVARDAMGKVGCREAGAGVFNPAALEFELSGRAGRAEFGGRLFEWRKGPVAALRRLRPARVGARPSARECFDADKIGGKIILRHWQPGDRFQPIGMKSAAKLQDLFVNAKIPAARRRELVLAATGTGGIFWVEGLRIGEACKITGETRLQLVWQPKFFKKDVAP
jgi:tRNA(Ile)-lysidine synthase